MDADGLDDEISSRLQRGRRPDHHAGQPIPADAVTGSGSGLDPHISPENAVLQAHRVADARKLPLAKVKELIEQNTDRPDLGVFGDPGVNVLMLNLALDKEYPLPYAPPASPSGAAPATSGPALSGIPAICFTGSAIARGVRCGLSAAPEAKKSFQSTIMKSSPYIIELCGGRYDGFRRQCDTVRLFN